MYSPAGLAFASASLDILLIFNLRHLPARCTRGHDSHVCMDPTMSLGKVDAAEEVVDVSKLVDGSASEAGLIHLVGSELERDVRGDNIAIVC